MSGDLLNVTAAINRLSTVFAAASTNTLGYVNVRNAPYNAVGDGVHDDTGAIQGALLNSPSIFIPDGTYKITAGLRLGFKDQHIWGGSRHGTIIVPTGSGCHGFTEGSTGETRCTIEHLSIAGGSTTGSGIYFPTLLTYLTELRDLTITMGADAVVMTNEFSSVLNNVFVSSTNGHGFLLTGGITTTLLNCYAGTISTAGKAGYKCYGGGLFLGCNGLNAGEIWGQFGATTAIDGFNAQFNVVLQRCNIEAWTGIGVRLVNAGNCVVEAGVANNVGSYTTTFSLETNTSYLQLNGFKFFTTTGTPSKLSDVFTTGADFNVWVDPETVKEWLANLDENGTLAPTPTTTLGRPAWTPTIQGSGTAGANTYTTQAGFYRQDGRQITAWFQVEVSGNSTPMVGTLQIAGLPLPVNSHGVGVGSGSLAEISNVAYDALYTQMMVEPVPGTSVANIKEAGSAQAVQGVPVANLGASNGRFAGVITYLTGQ